MQTEMRPQPGLVRIGLAPNSFEPIIPRETGPNTDENARAITILRPHRSNHLLLGPGRLFHSHDSAFTGQSRRRPDPQFVGAAVALSPFLATFLAARGGRRRP